MITLSPGTRLGPYEIGALLGAGGMGQVYRAVDTRLKRAVAVKVIASRYVDSPELRSRFRAEAEAIAAIAHPHICRLYDVGQQDGIDFLVMEYLEGETLATRLLRGRLPLNEAIACARSIADALDQSHRQGIIHRDVKPANVMLTPAGPKLLDFGVARLRLANVAAAVASQSTVVRAPDLTHPGDTVGTWQYMAPEQVRGEPADARSDVFALGISMYEMFTGAKPFTGAVHSDLWIAILQSEPAPMGEVNPSIPPAIVKIVASCLAKDPSARWQSAGDVRRALDTVDVSAPSRAAPASARRPLWMLGAAAVLLAIASALAGRQSAPESTEPPPMAATLRTQVRVGSGAGAVAFAPDGRIIVFEGRAEGRRRLYRRVLEEREAVAIAGTEGGSIPFISPDGQWIGFSVAAGLMKIPMTGGRPVQIAPTPAPFGASWGGDNRIVFSPGPEEGLVSVAADGGPTTAVTVFEPADEGNDHRWPQVLTGNRGLLFTVGTGPEDQARIVVLDLRSGTRKELLRGSASARFVPTGHVVYARDGELFAMPFDLESLSATGPPVRVAQGVLEETDGAPEYAFSSRGDLIYVPGAAGGPESTIAFVEMNGVVEPTSLVPRSYANARLSPDGRRAAYVVGAAKNNVFSYDLVRKAATRVTLGRYHSPVWFSDDRLTVAEGGPGDTRIVNRAADGSGGDEEIVPPRRRAQHPESWTPDRRTLFFRALVNGQWDLWTASPGGAPPRPYLSSPFDESNARVSPDGKWLAYVSDESGHAEAYVRALDGSAAREQLSSRGAVAVAWAPDSRRIYFRGAIADGSTTGIWTAELRPGAALRIGEPQLLFANAGFQSGFEVTNDGKRFLMVTSDRRLPIDRLELTLNLLRAPPSSVFWR